MSDLQETKKESKSFALSDIRQHNHPDPCLFFLEMAQQVPDLTVPFSIVSTSLFSIPSSNPLSQTPLCLTRETDQTCIQSAISNGLLVVNAYELVSSVRAILENEFFSTAPKTLVVPIARHTSNMCHTLPRERLPPA